MGQATPYQQQVYPPLHTSGVQTAITKASTTPSTNQGHDAAASKDRETTGRSSSQGPNAKTGEIDPPPEDLGNDAEASLVTTLWTMSPNMWPQAGEETSPTY